MPSWLLESPKSSSTNLNSDNNNPPPSTARKSLKPKLTYKQPIPPPIVQTSYDHDLSSTECCCCCCPDDPILFWFSIYHSIVIFVAIMTLLSNAYALSQIKYPISMIIMRVYAMLFCVIIIGLELDLQLLRMRLRLFDGWFYRGLFYGYVGLISVDNDKLNLTKFTINLTGLALIGIGVIYTIMGLLCIKSLKSNRQLKTQQYITITDPADDFASSPI
eukprot:gene10760-14451_t